MQLQAKKRPFDEAGIGIVVITYDSAEDQQEFVAKHEVSIPLVSDVESRTVGSPGLLNETIEPDNFAYGVTYPGIYVLSPDGRVRARSFLERLDQRLSTSSVLSLADAAL